MYTSSTNEIHPCRPAKSPIPFSIAVSLSSSHRSLNELDQQQEKGPHAYAVFQNLSVLSPIYPTLDFTPLASESAAAPFICSLLPQESSIAMCCIYGSRDQAIAVCPMCKVFKPSASRYVRLPRRLAHQAHLLRFRCPHKREVCRNRILHPKHDIVYLKNPEGELLPTLSPFQTRRITHHAPLSDHLVQLFSGCGYCKACTPLFHIS